MAIIDNIQVYNTGLTKEQVGEALSKSLEDYTKEEIDADFVKKISGTGLSTNDYTDADKTIVSTVFGKGAELEEGDDLDDITDNGAYYATVSTAITLDNTPVTNSAFRLEVTAVSTSHFIQKLFPAPMAGDIYIRSCDSSVWSSWYVFSGTAVTP